MPGDRLFSIMHTISDACSSINLCELKVNIFVNSLIK